MYARQVTSLLCSEPAVAPTLPTGKPESFLWGLQGPLGLAWCLPSHLLHSAASSALAVPCPDRSSPGITWLGASPSLIPLPVLLPSIVLFTF